MEARKNGKKRLIALAITLSAALAISAMTYAWFTSAVDPIKVDITAARIKVEQVAKGEWKIGTGENLLDKALPGETVSYGDVSIKNTSNRNAIAELDFSESNGIIKYASQTAEGKASIDALKTFLTSKRQSELLKFITNEKDLIVTADSKLLLYLNDNISEFRAQAGDQVAKRAYYGVAHMTDVMRQIVVKQLVNDKIYSSIVAADLECGPRLSDPQAFTGKYYIGLGVPTATNGTFEISDFSFKIPNDLGGHLVSAASDITNYGFLSQEKNHATSPILDEQEAEIHVSFGFKVVQATKAAVEDVFGFSIDDLEYNTKALISNN